MRAVQAAIYMPRHAKVWKFKRPYIAKRRDLSNRTFVYSYFKKVCRKKCTRQSRKVLSVVLSSMFFNEI